MKLPSIVFKNTGEKVRNDVIYDQIFELIDFSYVFTVFPKTKFWRFGLRFSKTKEILFDINSGNRHEYSEYKDLHLSVGTSPNTGQWENSNRLELTQYHFGPPNLLYNRCENYVELGPVQFGINYDSSSKVLAIWYSSGKCQKYETQIELNDYEYFKIFAWADKIDFELSALIEQMGKGPGQITDLKGNKVEFQEYELSFYVAGAVWNKTEDQTQRFLDNGIWENGYEDRYNDKVNSVNVNDILILKSTYQSGGVGYLRIKALGVVVENPKDGATLKVDWKIKDIWEDIDDLSKYRRTINKITHEEAAIILRAIGRDRLEQVGLSQLAIDTDGGSEGDFNDDFSDDFANQKSVSASAKIASLFSDGDRGEDHLEIDKDVNAFAKIMASKSFNPPLAVALFGRWGSGKSFFMNKLKDRINELSNNPKKIYCTGVSQIHFNAWSYLDANLWASLVTKIFQGLNEYITGDSLAKKYKAKIEKSLSHKLSITKEEKINLINQKRSVYHSLISLKNERSGLTEKLNEKIKQIRDERLVNIIDKINKSFKVEEKLKDAISNNASLLPVKEKIAEIVPEKYWNDPNIAYNEAKAGYTLIREFIRGENVFKNVFWLLFILSIILFVPPIIQQVTEYFWHENFTFTKVVIPVLTLLVPIIIRLRNTYERIKPIVSAFWKIKSSYELEIQSALFTHKQKEKALELEIQNANIEIESIDSQISAISNQIVELDFKLNNALATEALYSFIEKRENSEDYKKHLGIVSYIRKDFEILSELFVAHNDEAKEMRSKFSKPLERIVLYIDDLDRCPEDRVVEVLEAVNLLMAFPLFIVVVGVDPRWVKNALIMRYQLQFGSQINESSKDKEIVKIEASNYLEKIFQVPFHLKEADDLQIKKMIKALSEDKSYMEKTPKSEVNYPAYPGTPASAFLKDENGNVIINPIPIIQKPKEVDVVEEYLELSEREVELLQDLSGIVGNNPRGVKRFVNVYQVVKAHEGLIYRQEIEDKEFLILMLLLALPIGPFQKLTSHINEFIKLAGEYQTLQSFLVECSQNKVVFSDGPRVLDGKTKSLFADLYEILGRTKQKEVLLSLTPIACQPHLKFIRRFTFADII